MANEHGWQKRSSGVYGPNEYLFSKAEFAFLRSLCGILRPAIRVAPKVRLADVVYCCSEVGAIPLARIAQKHVDFVLFDGRTGRILGAIELDDRSHERDERLHRDEFVNSVLNDCGIPLLRVQAAWRYNPMVLRQQLTILLASGGVRQAAPKLRGRRTQTRGLLPRRRARTHSTTSRCSGATGRMYTSAIDELAACPSHRRMSLREQAGREPNSVAPRWRRT